MGIDWSHSTGGKRVLRISEKLDFECHKDFRSAINSWKADPKHGNVDVDLSQLNFIDSSGVGLLLLLKDAVRAGGHRVSFLNSSEALAPTLRLLNLDQAA